MLRKELKSFWKWLPTSPGYYPSTIEQPNEVLNRGHHQSLHNYEEIHQSKYQIPTSLQSIIQNSKSQASVTYYGDQHNGGIYGTQGLHMTEGIEELKESER